MFRYKSNKEQAIVIAALVILLCIVCLSGATLALFTSDPEDGTIGIVTTAGRIEMDIVDLDGQSLKGGTLQFQATADRPKIYFEPGAHVLTQSFTVQNNGNIPVNFRIFISEDTKSHTPEYYEEFYEAFEVWIVSKDSGEMVLDREFDGRLEAHTGTGEYCLMIRMKESADNTFQGQVYSGIGITVYAVQGNVGIEE